jgi:hypothetical protein
MAGNADNDIEIEIINEAFNVVNKLNTIFPDEKCRLIAFFLILSFIIIVIVVVLKLTIDTNIGDIIRDIIKKLTSNQLALIIIIAMFIIGAFVCLIVVKTFIFSLIFILAAIILALFNSNVIRISEDATTEKQESEE